MNKALQRHHATIRRREQIQIAMILTVVTAMVSIWMGFALVSALVGA